MTSGMIATETNTSKDARGEKISLESPDSATTDETTLLPHETKKMEGKVARMNHETNPTAKTNHKQTTTPFNFARLKIEDHQETGGNTDAAPAKKKERERERERMRGLEE